MAGTLTALEWQQALEAFGWGCAYCGDPFALTIDHYVPLAWGGGSVQSNTVPSCYSCNTRKKDSYPDEQTLAFVAPERLAFVRSYLEEVGRAHQARLNMEREPNLARDQQALQALKAYCEARAQEVSDPHAASYALLCKRIFGVTWDPASASQVTESLRWIRSHASDRLLKAACKGALRFFTAQLSESPSTML